MDAAKQKMATSEASIKSLYAGLHRTIIRFGLLIAAAWLFGAFSFYLSRKTGTDWFSRSVTFDLPDEALERAASVEQNAFTMIYCTSDWYSCGLPQIVGF